MPKKLEKVDQASCYYYFDEARNWFKFIFYKDFFPAKGCPPFLILFIPRKENLQPIELRELLKNRIKHAGFEIGHFTSQEGKKEVIEALVKESAMS